MDSNVLNTNYILPIKLPVIARPKLLLCWNIINFFGEIITTEDGNIIVSAKSDKTGFYYRQWKQFYEYINIYDITMIGTNTQCNYLRDLVKSYNIFGHVSETISYIEVKNEKEAENELDKLMGKKQKFDVILQNPPYDGRCHEQFLSKSIDLADVVCSVQPTIMVNKQNRFRKKYEEINKKLEKRLSNLEIIQHAEANNMFKLGNQIQELGIFLITKEGGFNIENFGFDSIIEKNLFKKIMVEKNSDVMSLIRSKNGFKYVDKDTYVLKPNECYSYQWHGGDNCFDAVWVPDNNPTSLVLVFKDKNEVLNYKNSLKTKFANYYYWNFVVPGDCKILTYMFRMKDYSEPWTDERFFKCFNLEKDEIKIIENFAPNN